MNKKLRLLVTTKCPNKCPMCLEWIENCPVPEGEDFRRIANLW